MQRFLLRNPVASLVVAASVGCSGSDGDGEPAAPDPDVPHAELTPPELPKGGVGYSVPARTSGEPAPTEQEIAAFTGKVTAFFEETDYFDWVWRTSHGMHESYDPTMMSYKLWWQDVGMRREGDRIVFWHHGRAENILKRSIKVLDNSLAGYLLTGDERMGQVATAFMRGVVALSLGLEFEREDPLVKYLQSRAVFNHNHGYEVDGREVFIDYEGMYEASFKWNVHVFEIPDNPTYGTIWVSNMRSKDDVPYLYLALPIVTRAYHMAPDAEVRDAAELFIEYVRGFSQSVVDNDWFILTKYEDGVATISLDTTVEGTMPADLGSFVHWINVFGPDAECTAQLGTALTGYGYTAGKGHCESGRIGWSFEQVATGTHFFNHNIYNYFHIGALAEAHLWSRPDLAQPLNEGLAYRFDQLIHGERTPNRDHKEFGSDLAGWLLAAATHGFPLNESEAKHIMTWYGDASDWYRPWPHWDPWTSLADGEEHPDYKAPRDEITTDAQGEELVRAHVRLVEMPYIFEYCYSPFRHPDSVPFIDCDVVAHPARWGEE
ncbi:MAG: hypothetical protein JRI23_20680 [Deltaproteobacteria bacterium]|jgi:hypothetical protein|nr:hypothetical protein [Deltaproteobacteria bacterium]MBW2534315.1 hypothetical protein [Deltaproteobacteria bacterium]